MKKIFLLFVLSLSSLLSFGQTKSEAIAALQMSVQMANTYLPQSLGVFSIDKLEIQGDDYLYYATIDETQVNFDDYIKQMQEPQTRSALLSIAMSENEQVANIFKASGLNIVFVCKGAQSQRQHRIVFSAEDIGNVGNDLEESYNELMKMVESQLKSMLPMDLGNGQILTDVYMSDQYLYFDVLQDESVVSIADLKAAYVILGDELEQMMVNEMACSTGPMERMMFKYVVEAKVGMKYIFRSATAQETVTFTITPEMMNNAFKGEAEAIPIQLEEELEAEIVEYKPSDEEEEAIPFQLVEEKPSYNGGDANEFSKWVNSRLVYPEIAKNNGVQGRVLLQFTIDVDGSVTNVKVLRGVDPALDREAVRVVSMSPKWKPGKQRGRAVTVTYTFPVIFQLN